MKRKFEITKPDGHRMKKPSWAELEEDRVRMGGLEDYVLATMKQDVKGGFTRWRKGEVVKARLQLPKSNRWYVIEKFKPVLPFLPLRSQCAFVPERVLSFSST